MRSIRIIQILVILSLVCSCNHEESVLSEYRELAKELKTHSSEYSVEDWEEISERFAKIEKRAEKCEFSPKEKKSLNKLRGQCAGYLIKGATKQAAGQMEEAIEQFGDIMEGFGEVFDENEIEDMFSDLNEDQI